jgi:Arc/MetJ-type ribon-helix-helix transcriptional regulator
MDESTVDFEISDEILQRLQALVNSGKYETLGDALRAGLDALDQYLIDRAAIQEGVEDESAGQMYPAREVLGSLRESHQ